MVSSVDQARIAAENQQNSLLLKLPPELRNRIYRWVFHGYIGMFNKGTLPVHERSDTALIRTCRQIRFEATALLYSTITIDFDIAYDIYLFVPRVTTDLRILVTSIRFSRFPAGGADRFICEMYAGDPVPGMIFLSGLEELRLMKGMITEETMQKAMGSQFRVNGKKLIIVVEE